MELLRESSDNLACVARLWWMSVHDISASARLHLGTLEEATEKRRREEEADEKKGPEGKGRKRELCRGEWRRPSFDSTDIRD